MYKIVHLVVLKQDNNKEFNGMILELDDGMKWVYLVG